MKILPGISKRTSACPRFNVGTARKSSDEWSVKTQTMGRKTKKQSFKSLVCVFTDHLRTICCFPPSVVCVLTDHLQTIPWSTRINSSRYVYMILLPFILCATSLKAQNCADKLRQVYRTSSAFNINTGFFLDYEVRVLYGGDGESKTEHLKVYGKDTKSMLESPDYQVYQDDSLIVSVLKLSKTIFIGPRGETDPINDQFNKIFTVQDSLISNAENITCSAETTEGPGVTRYDVVPHTEVKEKYGISQFSIWVPSGSMQMTRSEVLYHKGPLNALHVTVNDFKTSITGEAFPGRAEDVVLKAGKLKEKYKGYKLIDSRKTGTSNVN